MRSYTVKLFFILALVIPIKNYAQIDNLLSNAVEKKIEIKYNSIDRDCVNNKVLEIVAKSKTTPLKSTHLIYNVKEHQNIVKKNNKLQLQLAIGNFLFKDTVVYKKFNINNFLTPGIINYTYVWADMDDKVIEAKTVNNVKFKNGSYLLNKNVEIDADNNKYKLYLSKVGFGFTKSDYDKLKDFVLLVDSYYDIDAQLNVIDQDIEDMNIDSIEMLKKYKQKTIDNIKIFNQIHFKRFTSKLSLNTYDPINFKSHLGRVEEKNKKIKKDIEYTLNFMHITYYKKGMDWVKWGDKNKAKQFFEKSISEKPNYAPPYYQLAKMSFDKEHYKWAIDTCSLVLNSMNPDTDTRYNCVKLSESVIYIYIDSINSMIDMQRYDEAINKLEICENYSKTIPGVKRFEEFEQIHAKLFNVYYKNLITTAQQQIDNSELYKAKSNMDSSVVFRKAHAEYIQDVEQEHKVLKILYDKWIEQGLMFQNKNMSDSSLSAFNQASLLCNKYEVVYCTDVLEKYLAVSRVNVYNDMIKKCNILVEQEFADSTLSLLSKADTFRIENNIDKNLKADTIFLQAQQIKYNDYVEYGYAKYLKNNPIEALDFYDKAKAIDENYTIEMDTSLRSKIVIAAQKGIVTLCIQGESLIEVFNIDKATDKLQEAENIHNYYNMSGDKESVTAINSLKSKLKSSKCEQKQHQYNVQVLASKKFIEKQEFIYASNALEKAKKIAVEDSICALEDSATYEIAENISNMLYYQKRMVKIDSELKLKKYNNTIADYIELTNYYNDSCENNFGIEHPSLYEYISTNSNKGLIDFGIRYYLQLDKEDKALELLYLLHSKKYIVTWSKQSQTELGKRLARIDIEKNVKQDPNIKVLDYTKGDNWYRYLSKAYLKEWSNLKFETDWK